MESSLSAQVSKRPYMEVQCHDHDRLSNERLPKKPCENLPSNVPAPWEQRRSATLSSIGSAAHSSTVAVPESSTRSSNTLGEAECCFGMICEVGIRFDDEPGLPILDISTTRPTADEDRVFLLRLSFEESWCELLAQSGPKLATLNTKTFNQLKALQETVPLSWEGLISIHALTDAFEGSNPKKVTKISLNIYGRPDAGDRLALELSRRGLFLQDPYSIRENCSYVNPQYLELPAHEFDPELGPGDLAEDLQGQDGGALSQVQVSHGQASTSTDLTADLEFDHILDQFAQQKDLQQATANSLVNTVLLELVFLTMVKAEFADNHRYQREGLDFVLKRESLGLLTSRRLWEQQLNESTQEIYYQHLITGAKCNTPQDPLGGILADEMGLGKSLMMISAIVGSLSQAYNFAFAMTTKPGVNVEAVSAARSTLIVVPSALLMDNWIEEITKHTVAGTLSIYKYHGQSRNIALPNLLNHDVLLTTYATVAADFRRKRSRMFKILWYRIVLDEAHMIRNAATHQHRAVSDLRGYIRWCLTGTPIQNSLDDLGSLVSFIKVPVLGDAAQFRRHITQQTYLTKHVQKPDFGNLRLLLGAICLRRNRGILPLPPLQDCYREVRFSQHERLAYQQLGHRIREAIDLAVSGHKAKEAHQTVLEALLRMRIFCNNGDFFKEDGVHDLTEADEIGSLLEQKGEAICHYCSCDIVSFTRSGGNASGIVTACYHAVCGECLDRFLRDCGDREACPICHSLHQSFDQVLSLDPGQRTAGAQSFPSKLIALCEEVDFCRKEGKSIIFSFWKKSLDIVDAMLEDRGISHLRVDGSVPFSQRKSILRKFQSSDVHTVLLMTLGVGAVGLNNLSVANYIHILEPQWNPSVESQAIGRVVRLGQTKPVTVFRYIVKDTVEKNVQNGQLRKIQLAKNGFGLGKSMNVKKSAQMLTEMICASTPSD
ncbi:hypothetical protein LTR84_012665 [Exophiala bonariae]|uniref:Uncharacterized protein n=1 Tax=Exophiala bonariae TaxID=1690606 RepID=A0AAV9NIE1_9EURO|nr:hypothetical protein LTR84_012665 [Exophiala bonariae]